MKIVFKFFIGVFLIVCFSLVTHAQNNPGDPGCCPDETQVPIDGGVGLLIAAGVAYGAKKARDHRKKRTETGV
jgi:hypothetical protein